MAILYKDIDNDGLYDGYDDKNYFQEKGEQGERDVRDMLIKSLPDTYLLLNNLYTLTEEGDFTELDHILIHPKFILCVETKYLSGDLSALDIETWQQVNRRSGNIIKIDSPQQQAVHHAFSLQSYLEMINIQIPIYTVVVLVDHKVSSFEQETDKYYQSECPVIFKKDLIHLVEIIENQFVNPGHTSYNPKGVADQILAEHEGIKSSQLFWYKKQAMKEDNREAQYQLGKMYLVGYYEENGRAVQIKQNERSALFWLSKASKKGHKLARQKISEYYKS